MVSHLLSLSFSRTPHVARAMERHNGAPISGNKDSKHIFFDLVRKPCEQADPNIKLPAACNVGGRPSRTDTNKPLGSPDSEAVAMEKLPNELLLKILLPENFEWPADFDETTASIDELFDANFFNTWRRSWVFLRVCRTFNKVLKPVLSAKFKRQAVALLMLLSNNDSPHRRLQVTSPSDNASLLPDECEISDFKLFLYCWNLKDRQIVSLIHNIHQTLDEPEAAWPSLDGFPNLEMSLHEAESLMFLPWEERCRRCPQKAAYSNTCALKRTPSFEAMIQKIIHDRRHDEESMYHVEKAGQLGWYLKAMEQAAQHSCEY